MAIPSVDSLYGAVGWYKNALDILDEMRNKLQVVVMDCQAFAYDAENKEYLNDLLSTVDGCVPSEVAGSYDEWSEALRDFLSALHKGASDLNEWLEFDLPEAYE